VAQSDSEVVYRTVTQAKWDKGKEYIRLVSIEIGTRTEPIPVQLKLLEKARGYFNHLAIVYDIMLPNLKGFHNSIDGWREGRDIEDWKDEESSWRDVLETYFFEGKISEEEFDAMVDERIGKDVAPKYVMPVPRLFDDLETLSALMEGDSPAKVPARYSKVAEVIYGFGDASGRGLGSTIQSEKTGNIQVRMGIWSASEEIEESSNWKELTNVTEALESKGEKGHLTNAMVFFMTDNATVEAGIDKGNTTSKALHEKIVRIKRAQFKYSFVLFVIHCSGRRMIA